MLFPLHLHCILYGESEERRVLTMLRDDKMLRIIIWILLLIVGIITVWYLTLLHVPQNAAAFKTGYLRFIPHHRGFELFLSFVYYNNIYILFQSINFVLVLNHSLDLFKRYSISLLVNDQL